MERTREEYGGGPKFFDFRTILYHSVPFLCVDLMGRRRTAGVGRLDAGDIVSAYGMG